MTRNAKTSISLSLTIHSVMSNGKKMIDTINLIDPPILKKLDDGNMMN